MAEAVVFLLLAVLAVGQFLLFGAVAEAYRDIRQLREHMGAIDRPVPLDLGAASGRAPSELGLHPDLDSTANGLVVYVDPHCGTCRMIVSSLNGGMPKGVSLVVVADSTEEAFEWLEDAGFPERTDSPGRVTVVSAEEVERQLGVRVTPLAIEIEHGRLARARTIPSVRQFYALIPTTLGLGPLSTQEVPA